MISVWFWRMTRPEEGDRILTNDDDYKSQSKVSNEVQRYWEE